MDALFIILGAALGACLASFFNVVAERTVDGRSWWGNERSACGICGRRLTAAELVPIFSFLFQRGRCRGCGNFIGMRYVTVEIIGAAASGLLLARWGLSLAFLSALVAFFLLLLNALTDYQEGFIYDIYSLGMLVPAFLLRLPGGGAALLNGVYGAAAGFCVFAVIILLSRGGMGWGDAFLMCGFGGFAGWALVLTAFYLGIMAGGVGVLYLMCRGKVKWGKKQSVPLGPYLAVGCFLTLLFGPDILAYLGGRLGCSLPVDFPW